MIVKAAEADPSKCGPKSDQFADRFTEFLILGGVIDELAARRARKAQSGSGERFDHALQHLGLISEADLAAQLARFLQLPVASEGVIPAEPLHARVLDGAFLAGAAALPLSDDGRTLTVALADPFNDEAARAIGFAVERDVSICVMPRARLLLAIKALYAEAAQVASRTSDGDAVAGDGEDRDQRRLRDLASQAPVIRLVNDLIDRAVAERASDIHLEPRDDGSFVVRFRVDGVLHRADTLPVALAPAVVSRVKIMARLDIAERRLPQDGRIRTVVQGRELDLRISTLPTVDGEGVVMRLLDATTVNLDFGALGLAPDMRAQFERAVAQPNGIVLVTGPTGSGKTTTLYTALKGLDRRSSKVLTVEDPVEYRLEDVNQIQVQPRIGLTFASVLRAALRHDPDVVMVGEIRDLETAKIAVQASLTGHLVLSTVHTNGAVATVARLLDMGVERYLLAPTLKAVLAQRLVRRLCGNCARPVAPSAALEVAMERAGIALDRATLRAPSPSGCPACRHTGFAGRTMIAELMTVAPGLERAIAEGGSQEDIAAAAAASGFRTMLTGGLTKVAAGETTLEEVLRVVGGL